jgi:hypothetical protein
MIWFFASLFLFFGPPRRSRILLREIELSQQPTTLTISTWDRAGNERSLRISPKGAFDFKKHWATSTDNYRVALGA